MFILKMQVAHTSQCSRLMRAKKEAETADSHMISAFVPGKKLRFMLENVDFSLCGFYLFIMSGSKREKRWNEIGLN